MKSMKQFLIVLLISIFVIVGCSTQELAEKQDSPNPTPPDDQMIKETTIAQDTIETTQTKEFSLLGTNYKFMMNGEEAPTLKVKQGDLVKITFKSTGGFHDWVIDEFSAKTDRVTEGEITTVEFVADKKGTFEYYCSVGSHRSLGMVGKLIVE